MDGEELRDGADRMDGAREGADRVEGVREGADRTAPGLRAREEDLTAGLDGRDDAVPLRMLLRELERVVGREPTEVRDEGEVDREPIVERVREEVRASVSYDRVPMPERELERVVMREPEVDRVASVERVEVTPREVDPKAERVVDSERTELRAVRVASVVFPAEDVLPRTTFRVPGTERVSAARADRPPRVTSDVPRVRRPRSASEVRPIVVPRGAQLARPLPATTTPPPHQGLWYPP